MPLGTEIKFSKEKPYPKEIYERYCQNTGLDFDFYFMTENKDGVNKAFGISPEQHERMKKLLGQIELYDSLEGFSNDQGLLSFEHQELGSFTVEYKENGLEVDTAQNMFGYLEWAMIATLADLGSDDEPPKDLWYYKTWEEIQSQEGVSEQLSQLMMKEMEVQAYRKMLDRSLDILMQNTIEQKKWEIYAQNQTENDAAQPVFSKSEHEEMYIKLIKSIDELKGLF